MCESSTAFETKLEIESSLLSASVLILSCFLAFESKIFRVPWITADPIPSRRHVEARTTLTGMPIPVEARPMEVPPKMVIAEITEVSLKVAAVARRLNCFVSLSRDSTSLLRNFSSSSIFLSLWFSPSGGAVAVAGIGGYIFSVS